MPWLLLLHISALICWCGSLLYLPALVASSVTAPNASVPPDFLRSGKPHMPRTVFTLIATPAALVAIASGTAVFLVNAIVQFWLLAKLTLVAALVIVHMLVGWLITRVEQQKYGHLKGLCISSGAVAAALMTSIIWLVLSKPLQEV